MCERLSQLWGRLLNLTQAKIKAQCCIYVTFGSLLKWSLAKKSLPLLVQWSFSATGDHDPWYEYFFFRVKVRCLLIGGKCTEVSLGTGKQEIYEWQVPNLFLAQGSDKNPVPCPNSSLWRACQGGIGWLMACDHTPTAASHHQCPKSVYFYNRSASH